MNEPQFVISGIERRKVKKELSLMKFGHSGFWRWHTLEKDMCGFYGGNALSDEDAQKLYNKTQKQIAELEKILSEKLK